MQSSAWNLSSFSDIAAHLMGSDALTSAVCLSKSASRSYPIRIGVQSSMDAVKKVERWPLKFWQRTMNAAFGIRDPG